jgi:hypothetical protein
MHFYIVSIALALCGGFFVHDLLLRKRLQREAVAYYRAKYNEQMAELCKRYRQERAAICHRMEGTIADLERELIELRRELDPDKTKLSEPTSIDEILEEVASE